MDNPETNEERTRQAAENRAEVEIDVEKWVYGGDALARREGRVILTPFLLPGEKARVATAPHKGGLLTGKLVELIRPAPERVEAPCPYFGTCGGCQYQEAQYEYQLARKVEILREVFRRLGKMEAPEQIETISGDPWHYRNRTQLHLQGRRIGYLAAGSHELVPITHCPISSPRLNEAIGALVEMSGDRRFPNFLRSVELFTNETEVQVNVLDTERPVARTFFEWCEELLPGATARALDYRAAGEIFRVSHKSFFQVNRYLVDRLVEAAVPREGGESALDLYAGVGLFSLPLAQRFRKVTAVEGSPTAARDLEFNASRAMMKVDVEQVQTDMYLERLTTVPEFVLADPPRAGLGKSVTRQLLRLKPERLTIVACDPATLARDLAMMIGGGYVLRRVTLVDLFPQTYHLETIAEMSR